MPRLYQTLSSGTINQNFKHGGAFYWIDRFEDLETEVSELLHQGLSKNQKQEIKKTAWENLPRLGGMIAATAGGLLLRRTTWGMAAQLLAPLVIGTASGTLAQVGLKYSQYQWDKEHGKNPEEIDWGNLWLQSANDAFGASMSISIGGGVTVGLGALSSRYGANLLVRLAASNIGRGIIVNESIGIAHAIKNWDHTYGIEDVVISAGTGALGGAWVPLLQNRVVAELFCEINREFGENILQKKFDRFSDGDLTIQNVTESFVLSFAELGGSIKGHRGGLDPDHEPPTTNHQFRASLPLIAGLVALGIDISTYAINSDDQSTDNQHPPVSSAAVLLFGIRKRNERGDLLPPQGRNKAHQLPESAKRMDIPKRGGCFQGANALLKLLADNNINGQLILLTQAGGIRMRQTVWGDEQIRYAHHYAVLVNDCIIDRTIAGELRLIPLLEYVQTHFEQPDQVRIYPDCVVVEYGELYRHHPFATFETLDVEEDYNPIPYLTDLTFLPAPEVPITSHVITLEDYERLERAKERSAGYSAFDDDATSEIESREVDLDYYRGCLREAQDREDRITEQLWTQYLNRYQTQAPPPSLAVRATFEVFRNLVISSPHIIAKTLGRKGIPIIERLLDNPATANQTARVLQLCAGDHQFSIQLARTINIRSLEPHIIIAVLAHRAQDPDGSRDTVFATMQDLLADGERRARAIAHFEGRTYEPPAPEPTPVISISTELAFTPNRHPHFAPMTVTLTRQGNPCPLIIERLDYNQALALLQNAAYLGRHQKEAIKEFGEYTTSPDSGSSEYEPFFLFTRTLDGQVEGMSIYYLFHRKDGTTVMQCDRDIKFDRNRTTAISFVGLANRTAALRYMREHGHWPEMGDILVNINLAVLNRIRERLGGPVQPWWPSMYMREPVSGIEAREGEFLLELLGNPDGPFNLRVLEP